MDTILSAIDQQIHRLDAIHLAAIAITIATILVALVACVLIVALRSLWRLDDLRNLERDGYVCSHDALQAVLRQVTTCASEVSQLRQEMASDAASSAAQLKERKKILKTIAGHLKADIQPMTGVSG
jgi:hypothetical protein